MGSKYPVLKPSEITRVLRKLGYKFKSQAGSHMKYERVSKTGLKRTVIVPDHDEVAKGTFQSILEQAGISLDDFMKKLK